MVPAARELDAGVSDFAREVSQMCDMVKVYPLHGHGVSNWTMVPLQRTLVLGAFSCISTFVVSISISCLNECHFQAS